MMTRAEFQALPMLLFENQAIAFTGYARPTLAKMIDAGVFFLVRPAGCGQGKLRKVQLAQIAGLDEWLLEDAARFKGEPWLMPEKAVSAWTGYDRRTLAKIGKASGIHVIHPPGLTVARYRKLDVAEWIGLKP